VQFPSISSSGKSHKASGVSHYSKIVKRHRYRCTVIISRIMTKYAKLHVAEGTVKSCLHCLVHQTFFGQLLCLASFPDNNRSTLLLFVPRHCLMGKWACRDASRVFARGRDALRSHLQRQQDARRDPLPGLWEPLPPPDLASPRAVAGSPAASPGRACDPGRSHRTLPMKIW
jgi:hypothetical protein